VTRFDQIGHAGLSDVGIRRSHNQDSLAVLLATDEEQWRRQGHLYVVADGMGAHAVGEKASALAASVIPHIYHKHAEQEGPATALRKAFVEANASIHACGQQNREFQGMGTTATALVLRPDGAWVAHVGDSRAYRVRGGRIEQLTFDHSLLWEYARIKKLDPDEVRDIPANVIHRCLGPEPLVQVDVEGPHPVRPGDVYLLCSDGLSGQVSDPDLGAVAGVLPPEEACQFLVDLANLQGGPDNITALIVRVGVDPGANGDADEPRPRRRYHVPPWPMLALLAGTVLVAGAFGVHGLGAPKAALLATFVVAVAANLAGLLGLYLQYRREKGAAGGRAPGPGEPRVYRRFPCSVERPLLDKMARALEVLRQRADERGWEVDRDAAEAARELAQKLLQSGDLVGAFRELCRAILPYTRALERQRNKEEVFQPVWDKPPA
jgi:protein phosphatase